MPNIVFDTFLPLPLLTWKRPRVVARGTVSGIRVRMINDKKYKQAKSQLGWEIKAADPKLRNSAEHRFGFYVNFHLPGVAGGDGDRYENLVMDALQGIVWENDNQVDEGSWRKTYDCEVPGMQLTIWRLP